jgi:hypothetical protein
MLLTNKGEGDDGIDEAIEAIGSEKELSIMRRCINMYEVYE